ncbi:MAG: ankyrin repeat domain-containing protein, partial [Planctomycetes bacterium]|nr:ankyrin repeat domain-containing protein [Planctomycetota bacterium]
MGKPARLTLTILLFLGLGLATSVAVAWGVMIHAVANADIDRDSWTLPITELHAFRRVPAQAMADQDNDTKLHWVYFPRQKLPLWSRVHGVPESARSHLVETAAGWPFLCLMHTGMGVRARDRGLDRLPRNALMGKLHLSSIDPGYNDITRLPIQPVWRNLLVNSVFWGIAWFLLFCLPCVWRLNLWLRWRPKGRCVWCGYDLRHAPEGRCPECGKVAAVRPRVFLMPGLAMPVILVVAGLFSIGAFAWIFAQQHEYDPIHWASHSGDIERVRHELDGGVNVDVMTRDGRAALSTPILLAIFNHHEEIAVMLLEAGADVSLGSQSEVAIGYAVEHDNLRLFDLLIEAGADVNVSLPSGYTLLMSAALNSNVEMVRRLLEECVDVNATSTFGQSAIQTAAGSGNQ